MEVVEKNVLSKTSVPYSGQPELFCLIPFFLIRAVISCASFYELRWKASQRKQKFAEGGCNFKDLQENHLQWRTISVYVYKWCSLPIHVVFKKREKF